MSTKINRWKPKVKITTEKLMKYWTTPDTQGKSKLNQQGARSIVTQGQNILGYCADPIDPNAKRTMLAVGRIQSGKTMSMIGLTALAKDNGFGLIIILAGTKKNLVEQTNDRFQKALRKTSHTDKVTWQTSQFDFFTNPTQQNAAVINNSLSCSAKKWKTHPLCIIVMKHHGHLETLTSVLSQTDVKSVPTLIFDDEADQASLDTTPTADTSSTTFRRIQELRETVCGHTFIQYTATPYAPLWLQINDQLSPDVGVVLSPGKGYTGVREYFMYQDSAGDWTVPPADKQKYRVIPSSEINQYKPSKDIPYPQRYPDSLKTSFCSYLVAAANHFCAEIEKDKMPDDINCSMMIHPHSQNEPQSRFYSWTQRLKNTFDNILNGPQTDIAYANLKADLHKQYIDLQRTASNLKPFDDLLRCIKNTVLRSITIYEVNSDAGHEVIWENSCFHILIGGFKLDRGFTIEGLITTLMHRDTGNQADTLQQRARFFGYRSSYLDLCRIWLSRNVLQFYQQYHRTEEDLHRLLQENEGYSLKHIKKTFLLQPQWQPCRKNVLVGNIVKFHSDWTQNYKPYNLTAKGRSENNQFIEKLIQNKRWQAIPQHKQHKKSRMTLSELWELLVEINLTGEKNQLRFMILYWVLDKLIEDKEAVNVDVYRMHGEINFTRKRTIGHSDVQIFQGRNNQYVGDAALRSGDAKNSNITCQIHHVEVFNNVGTSLGKHYYIAIHIPSYWGTHYQGILA